MKVKFAAITFALKEIVSKFVLIIEKQQKTIKSLKANDWLTTRLQSVGTSIGNVWFT